MSVIGMKKIILDFVFSMATFIYIGSLHLLFPSRTSIQCGISQWFMPITQQPRESKFQDSRNGSYNYSQTYGSSMGNDFNKLHRNYLTQKLEQINKTTYDSQNQDYIGGKLEALNFLPFFNNNPYKDDNPNLARAKKIEALIKLAKIRAKKRKALVKWSVNNNTTISKVQYLPKELAADITPRIFLRLYNDTCPEINVKNICPCIPENLGKSLAYFYRPPGRHKK